MSNIVKIFIDGACQPNPGNGGIGIYLITDKDKVEISRALDGTVTNNIKQTVKALKDGQIEIKNDQDGNIGASIGKKSFPDSKIIENYKAFMEVIQKEKPNGIKGDFIMSSYLTSTMGVSYKIKTKAQ